VAAVRCNGLDTPWGLQDLQAIAAAGPDVVLAPKVSSAAEVQAYDRALAGLVQGPNDLGAELRLKGPSASAAIGAVLFQMTVAARAHGLLAFGGPYNAIDDAEGFRAECAEEAGLGLDGKTLIHPSQIAAANAAFSPSPEEIAWAERVVAAFAAPDAAGRGAIRLDGRMIERLHLKAAERTLALAGR
jgi:citrate lyase subunit beta/citryl-CoA lyase